MADGNKIPVSPAQRAKRIVRVGLWGIAVNFLYAGLKGAIGLLSGSIAISIDAVNNLNDAITSVIAVGGIKLASKPADRQHPFGHGRIEYVGAMLISTLIVIVGAAAFVNAVEKIISPTETHYNAVMLAIMATGVVAKFSLGVYTARAARSLDSDSLWGSGAENLFDSVVGLGTMVSAGILMIWDIDLDGWFAAVISLVLVRSGLKILKSTFNDILGRRIDAGLSSRIKADIMEFPQVEGVYDLIVNNYGAKNLVGSVNIEIPETLTAREIHALTLKIQRRLSSRYHLYMAVGIYAASENPEVRKLECEVEAAVMSCKGARQLHGFFVDGREVSFDIVVDFSVKDRDAFALGMQEKLHGEFPAYTFNVNVDIDYCD